MSVAPVELTVVADRLEADLRALSDLVEPDRPGWTRTALGPVDREGRELVRRWMVDEGLETSVDGAAGRKSSSSASSIRRNPGRVTERRS